MEAKKITIVIFKATSLKYLFIINKNIFYDKKGTWFSNGRGNQYMPWVHVDDVVSVFFNAFIQKIPAGTYNVVSSQHVNNEALTYAIAKALNKKIRLCLNQFFYLLILISKINFLKRSLNLI